MVQVLQVTYLSCYPSQQRHRTKISISLFQTCKTYYTWFCVYQYCTLYRQWFKYSRYCGI